jgi:hypothetical protein
MNSKGKYRCIFNINSNELTLIGHASPNEILNFRIAKYNISEMIWSDPIAFTVPQPFDKSLVLNLHEIAISDKRILICHASNALLLKHIEKASSSIINQLPNLINIGRTTLSNIHLPNAPRALNELPNVNFNDLPQLFGKIPQLALLSDIGFINPDLELFLKVIKDERLKTSISTISLFLKQLDSFSFPIIVGLSRFESFVTYFHTMLKQVLEQLNGHLFITYEGDEYINRILNGCECYIVIIGEKIINAKNDYRDDNALSKRISCLSLSQFDVETLGIPIEKIDINVIKQAGMELLRFEILKTPLDKIKTLLKLVHILKTHIQKTEIEANSDSLLSYLILTIIRTNPASIGSNLNFTKLLRSPIRYFSFKVSITGIEAYLLVSLESACVYIESIDLSTFGIPNEILPFCNTIKKAISTPESISSFTSGFNVLSDLQQTAVGYSQKIWKLNLISLITERTAKKPVASLTEAIVIEANDISFASKFKDQLSKK